MLAICSVSGRAVSIGTRELGDQWGRCVLALDGRPLIVDLVVLVGPVTHGNEGHVRTRVLTARSRSGKCPSSCECVWSWRAYAVFISVPCRKAVEYLAEQECLGTGAVHWRLFIQASHRFHLATDFAVLPEHSLQA